ncbi:MAG: phosphate ABC transporter permease subunit PstC [Deltaproteobacteria bacterium]|nr:phosphate ABC transporter permease subunit PstC [Deltaproteobacteria bacterium]
MNLTFFVVIIILTLSGFLLGRSRSLKLVEGRVRNLHSMPGYYGLYVALWCGIPALMLVGGWLAFESTIIMKMVVSGLSPEMKTLSPDRLALVINDIQNLASGNIISKDATEEVLKAVEHLKSLKSISFAAMAVVGLSLSLMGLVLGLKYVSPKLRARNKVESTGKVLMILCSTIAVFTTVGIVLSVLFEAIRFFELIPVSDFLFGLKWSPQMAIRPGQVGASGSFGVIPLLAGTMLISLVAMLVAVPIGLMSAIYMSEYAAPKFRAIVKPLLEILAGIPTVVYGFFAALVVAPFIKEKGALIGLDISSGSALAVGVVMGIMIIPFVSSLTDDVLNAVPQSLRDGSYGLGATQSETIVKVLLQAALPGIVASILLAVSRAIGETMIVVMAAGLTANLTANPLESVTTVTVQIVTLLVGDQEFNSPKTLAAFALGLVLFVLTLCLNIIALYVVRKYRQQYD